MATMSAGLGLVVCLFLLRIVQTNSQLPVSKDLLSDVSQVCIDEFLVTAENKSAGVQVSIFTKDGGGGSHQTLTTELISDRFLSSECGPKNLRCQDLLVISSQLNATTTQYILFIPLVDGLLLLDLRYNGTQRLSFSSYHIINIQNIGCSPTSSFNVLRSTYTVCLGIRTQYLTVLKVLVNTTSIRESRISGPLIRFHGLEDPPRVSNFLYVPLQRLSIYHIYFATARYLYALDPRSYLAREIGELASCNSVTLLANAGDETLIAYCSDDSAIYFDINSEEAGDPVPYSQRGQPFICPNPDVRLAVYPASYIQYGLRSRDTRDNINIPGLEFDSGVCFGTQNTTLFAYVDREDGVYVLELPTFSLKQLSSQDCLNGQCDPLSLFDNRYIVVRERDHNDATAIVVDSKNNFSKIITARHTRADLLTVLVASSSRIFCDVPVPTASSTPTLDVIPPPSLSELAEAAVTLVGIILFFIILLLILLTIVLIVRQRRIHSNPGPNPPIPETGEDMRVNLHQLKRRHERSASASLSEEDIVLALQAPETDIVKNTASNNNADKLSGGVHTTGPEFMKLREPNQVYPSVPALMDTLDPNLPTLALADRALEVKEENPTSREVHEKGEKDRHPMNVQLLPMDSQTTRPSGSANFAEAAECKDPLVLPAENTGGCEIKLQSLDKVDVAPSASLSHNSSASSTGPTYSQHSTEGHESEGEQFPKSESDSDREGQSDDHLIPGNDRPVPKVKVRHAIRKNKKGKRGETRNNDMYNISAQIAQEDSS